MTAPTAHDPRGPVQPSERERLQQLARAAGYGRDVLEAIADAALHPHQPKPGQRATDRQLRQITGAVDVLVTAGRTGAQILTRLGGFKDAGGDWRFEFWRAELAQANRNDNAQRCVDARDVTREQHAQCRADQTPKDIQPIRGLGGIADLGDDDVAALAPRA